MFAIEAVAGKNPMTLKLPLNSATKRKTEAQIKPHPEARLTQRQTACRPGLVISRQLLEGREERAAGGGDPEPSSATPIIERGRPGGSAMPPPAGLAALREELKGTCCSVLTRRWNVPKQSRELCWLLLTCPGRGDRVELMKQPH